MPVVMLLSWAPRCQHTHGSSQLGRAPPAHAPLSPATVAAARPAPLPAPGLWAPPHPGLAQASSASTGAPRFRVRV